MKIKRAFIDVNGDFAVFREKGGKKNWFHMRVVDNERQINQLDPKSDGWNYLFGSHRLHIHNNWLYCGNRTVKAIKIVGSDIDLDMIIAIMEMQKQKMAGRLDKFRHEHPRNGGHHNTDVISAPSRTKLAQQQETCANIVFPSCGTYDGK